MVIWKYATLVVVCFIGGWYLNCLRYEHNMQEFINSELQQQIQAVEDARSKEQEYREKLDKTTRQAKEAIDVVNAHYRKLLNDSLSKSSASNQNSVPSASGSSVPISKSTSKCTEQHRAKLQRLYEQQLVIARDCDITAAHYNELIDFYEALNK